MAFQQYDYLIGRFQDGDFPNGQDFNDLIDSTYNFSLSNLPELGLFLQSVSGNWENTYQTYSSLSGDYVTFNYVNNDFLNLAGGVIDGTLDVEQHILSGGTNLLNIFQTAPQRISFNENNCNFDITGGNTVSLSALSADKQNLTYNENTYQLGITNGNTISLSALSADRQELSYNENTYRLGITNGNTVSLSALSADNQTLSFNSNDHRLSISNGNNVPLSGLISYVNIPFTHSPINPSNNTTYTFGSISNLQPVVASLSGNASRQVVSQYNGRIVEASIIIDNTNRSVSENLSQFSIRNITTNLSAIISEAIKYREGVETPVPLLPLLGTVTFNTDNIAPAPQWTPATSVDSDPLDYTIDGAYFKDNGTLTTPAINNAQNYSFLQVQFQSQNFGGDNTPNAIKVDVLINDTPQNLNLLGRTDDSINPETSIINLTGSNGVNPTLTSNTKIKFSKNNNVGSIGKKIFEVKVSGVNITPTGGTKNYTVTPLLSISKNDLLEVRWITPVWGTPPTDVINLITAKVQLSAV